MKNKTPNENLALKLKDGRQLSYAEYGAPDGQPIFYFHGFPGSRLEARHFHDVAVAKGYRLIAIDRPGMGLSSMDTARMVLSWAADVSAFADSLGIDKFSILGHSGGAPFVAACAYAIPERLNGAAIVSGMAPLYHPESKTGMARSQIIVNRLIQIMPWLTTVFMRLTLMVLKKPDKMKGQIRQLPEVDQVYFHSPETGQSIINSALEAFRNGISGPSYEMKLFFNPWGFNLEQVKYPIMIWHGGLDSQVPVSHAKLYAKLIPNAELQFLEYEGHHSLIRNHTEKILRSICPKNNNNSTIG